MADVTPSPDPHDGPPKPTPAEDRRFWGLVVALVVFLGLGLVPLYDRHPYFPFEDLGFFPAVYGLTGCIGLLLGANGLRTWIMRDEDYYDDE